MASAAQFIRTDREGLDEFRIGEGEASWVKSPSFIPEISGPEDIHAILNYVSALEPNNPILVPGYRWGAFRTKPEFGERKDEITRLVKDHPLLYYEPPELFRYKLPSKLVTYALKGSISQRRKFNSNLLDGDIEQALDMLPKFFRAFVERQLERLCEIVADEDDSIPQEVQGVDKKIHDAWMDPKVNEGISDYYLSVVRDAAKFPNSYVIPPSPPLLESSDKDDIRRAGGANKVMMNWCQTVRENPGEFDLANHRRPIYSYYHLYLDYGFLKSGISQDILDYINSELSDYSYGGIAMTISNYPKIWDNSLEKSFEGFVNELMNIAQENHLPVICPRSKWYGAYLTDFGIHGYSSMLNSSDRYQQSSGGMRKKEYRWGKIPVIDRATEIGLGEIQEYLEDGGELPQIEGLPSIPPGYSDVGDDIEDKFGTAREFRIKFGKPRRLAHIEEARRIRDGKINGLLNPAKRHLEDSDHPHLSG